VRRNKGRVCVGRGGGLRSVWVYLSSRESHYTSQSSSALSHPPLELDPRPHPFIRVMTNLTNMASEG